MSTFRNAIAALNGKDVYFFMGSTTVKATISKINDDLVVLKLSDASGGYSEVAIHIDHLILVTA